MAPADTPGSAAPAADDYADDRLRMLELRHRTKNILAIVQSLVHQTLRGDVSIEDARRTLGDRLVAMSKAVDVLMRTAWHSAPLEEVVAGALTHLGSFSDRVAIAGTAVEVGPTAAMTLSLAFHELESNAIKYGALSDGRGRVDIGWSLVDRGGAACLELDWIESGGPRVTPPTRSGFGTRLISRAIGQRLDGAARAEFLPEGFRWHLSASIEELAV